MYYDRFWDQYSDLFYFVVTVNVPGFGDTYTVADLGQNSIRAPYFGPFIRYFVDRGYVRGKSIRAAPYDWRLAPGE